MDPWLFGSCYWRSWWHYPPSQLDAAVLRPDYVSLTHHHFDHFHFPSMRRIDRTAQVLIPRFAVDVMAAEVKGLGFRAPCELPHGRVIEIDAGVRVASFQYGFDDSAFVVAVGEHVVVNLNDAKFRGLALRQIRARFGRPTLAFKSHSFAQSYPVLYTAADADDAHKLALVSRETYIEDFRSAMEVLQPRYAVPFASMVGFLHPQSEPVNRHVITPPEVLASLAGRLDVTKLVAMAPGDAWCSEEGFRLSKRNWYDNRDGQIKMLAAKASHAIQAQFAAEREMQLDWPASERYFGAFVAACSRFLGARLAPKRFVFLVPSDVATPYWWVSLRERSVGRAAAPPADRASVTTAPEAVLADAIEKKIVNLIHISMRMRVQLAAGGVRSDLAFWALLTIWELGYLPLRNMLRRPRFWAVAVRRWREGLGTLGALLRHDAMGALAQRFSARDER